jgi:archaellum biogenesis ATPase FlaH/Zn ribbon nucleic-acid-binding protein
MSKLMGHFPCPECGSKDNLAKYLDDDGEESHYCWGCGHVKASKQWLEENSDKIKKSKVRRSFKKKEIQKEVTLSTKEALTSEENEEIKSKTSSKGNGYRSIKDFVTTYFGVRTSFDESTGEVVERFYPCTQDGQLTGYKIRQHPKSFFSKGRTGIECQLFGQFRFNRGGRYVIITEGEEDALAAYQMMKEYYDYKKSDFEIAVVSPTVGANSQKQIANQYQFFDTFENIILSFDNDEAGKKAIEKVVQVLPKGKVKIMTHQYKDANDYLEKGEEKKYIRDFYDAKPYVPVGVVGSNQISSAMRDEMAIPKIPLPPFMHKLQKMMAGGIPLGRIINLGSASGTGKSTIVDELIYFWLFNSPHKNGIVTLESTVGQYGIKLLSRHVSKKIELLEQTQALDFLDTKEIQEKEYELFNTPEGQSRFYLVDDRDGGVENIQDAIENLIIGCDCKVIVLDPIHDVIAELPLEEQGKFTSWQKGMVKSHMVTFINVCHTRKTGGGQRAGSEGATLVEEDIMGSSSLYKSAACNLMFSRNKDSEDDIERNTTVMKATKIRWTGNTGTAGKYYYDNETHTLHDLDDWLNKNQI